MSICMPAGLGLHVVFQRLFGEPKYFGLIYLHCWLGLFMADPDSLDSKMLVPEARASLVGAHMVWAPYGL